LRGCLQSSLGAHRAPPHRPKKQKRKKVNQIKTTIRNKHTYISKKKKTLEKTNKPKNNTKGKNKTQNIWQGGAEDPQGEGEGGGNVVHLQTKKPGGTALGAILSWAELIKKVSQSH